MNDRESTSWIFGYGSLMWRPGFPFIERREGFIRGWKRRFHQGSPDHRGTPEFPGRVVTLLEEREATTWGVAYQLDPASEAGTLMSLDQREQAGYQRVLLPVFSANGELSISKATTWIATPENSDHLGEAPLDEMIAQILHASGPSGSNRDYVLALEQCLAAMSIVEDHVQMLAHGVTDASRNSNHEPQS